MTYRYILFDLDGTLADPKLGITKSAQYALARFGLRVVCGGTLDDSISKKEDIVRQALYELSNPAPDKAVMVGDTQYDLIGAEQNGIDFIGVTYGYGFRKDTDPPGQSYGRIVDTIEDLWNALLY
ncbi:MAG: hypothetical protein AMS17_06815 [Spirochaetes bacterium DG_61]|jgi:phosphoglycolate phosphatase|nr:MAG: hypothetical protein AMS17_06815 [Spirochaetes bacterium DG_61]